MKPQKEYEYGLIWVPAGNPLNLKQGYYKPEQIEKALDKNPDKTRAWYKFMSQ
jgi:hypothetical protein